MRARDTCFFSAVCIFIHSRSSYYNNIPRSQEAPTVSLCFNHIASNELATSVFSSMPSHPIHPSPSPHTNQTSKPIPRHHPQPNPHTASPPPMVERTPRATPGILSFHHLDCLARSSTVTKPRQRNEPKPLPFYHLAFYGLGRSGLKVSYISKKRTIFDKADRVTETCKVLIV
jgi:hypothetical protein